MTHYDEIKEGMRRPEAYPHPVEEVELVTTAISAVFLAGDFAYKVKKPVDTGFLDYSTLERRKHFCELEVKLNRRLSPEIYLGVVPVVRSSAGIEVDGPGTPLEYAVKMKRLPGDKMMELLLLENMVGHSTVREVAGLVADFHSRAETSHEIARYGKPDYMRDMIDRDFEQMDRFLGLTISEAKLERIKVYLDGELDRNSGLMSARASTGSVRDLHGDLHSRNICIPGPIYIFDCIEFEPAFRCSDVAKEVAFLAMDLEFHNHRELSGAYVAEYLLQTGDEDMEELLAFYRAWLSSIRGKVNSMPRDSEGSPQYVCSLLRARKHFDLADRYSGGREAPWMVVMMGAMGTGKSHFASELRKWLPLLVLDSDVIRKEIAGIPVDKRKSAAYGEDIYTPEMTEKVYSRMIRTASDYLDKGYWVLLDASFIKRRHREMARRTARDHGAHFLLVECEAPRPVVEERLRARESEPGPSDGRVELLSTQMSRIEGPREVAPRELLVLETDTPVQRQIGAVAARMESVSRPHSG